MINPGDTVTTTTPVEALYSGYRASRSLIYPVQYFNPGMLGTVLHTNSPAMRRNVSQIVVEFEGDLVGKSTKWVVRLDKKFVQLVKKGVEGE